MVVMPSGSVKDNVIVITHRLSQLNLHSSPDVFLVVQPPHFVPSPSHYKVSFSVDVVGLRWIQIVATEQTNWWYYPPVYCPTIDEATPYSSQVIVVQRNVHFRHPRRRCRSKFIERAFIIHIRIVIRLINRLTLWPLLCVCKINI